LIYSEAFDALPLQLKEVIYQRLWHILNGLDSTVEPLPPDTRAAVRGILLQTDKPLPRSWN
jgi:hypothetical protein